MQLIWNKTFLPDENYIRSPLYETSLHHYNDNGLSINVDIHMTIAIDKKDNCYLLFIWDTTPGIRDNDKTTLIPDIPLYKYDLSSILIFAHDFLDKFIIDRYGYILNRKNTHAKKVTQICNLCDHFICDDVEHLVGHCNELNITRCSGDLCIMGRKCYD